MAMNQMIVLEARQEERDAQDAQDALESPQEPDARGPDDAV